jgi:hypothetical protein
VTTNHEWGEAKNEPIIFIFMGKVIGNCERCLTHFAFETPKERERERERENENENVCEERTTIFNFN